ncbi:MAG: ROK family transcriptional regulator [archaeon]
MNEENFITGNAKVVRSINRAMILNIIRTKQPIHRTEIAKITGLNKSTVSSIVNSLLEENLIFEQVKPEQNVGRNPVNLFLRKNSYLTGAISIDADTASLAIIDIDGSIIAASAAGMGSSAPEDFLKSCLKEIRALCAKNGIEQLEGIGISIGGIVGSGNSILSYMPDPRWENINVHEIIREQWPELKIFSLGSDAKSGAMAELWFGTSAFNLSSFVFVSISSGINSGIVIENKLLDSGSQASGEFGHIPVVQGGEICACGNSGCWERYASDSASIKRYLEKIAPEKPAEKLTLKDIIELAGKNNQSAVDALKETGYYLGLGITNIVRSIDPQAVILSGTIIQAWDIIYPEIIKVVKEKTFFGRERTPQIIATSLSGNSKLLGAATLVIKEIFDYYRITTE